MKNIKRRSFLKSSMAAGAATLLPFSRVLGANDDVRVAVVGMGSYVKIGGKGRQEVNVFRKMPGVRVVALCDPDSNHLGPEVEKSAGRNEKVDAYRDVRKLLEDRSIDALVNATPNHWHALVTIWACRAGKDVFVEKPLCHTVWEGRKMVEAARKYDRIVQCGSGTRANRGLKQAFEYVQEGNLGKILLARGINYKPRSSIGKVDGPQPIPKSLDYDLWAGPAEKVPMMRQYLHYDWHWDWSTGNGDLGNMGIHYLDTCRWALGQQQLPPRVMCVGGRFGYTDDGRTPNTQIAILDYQPAPIIFEVRGLPKSKEFQDARWNNAAQSMDLYRGIRLGVVIECEHGYLVNNVAYDKAGKEIRRFAEEGPDLRANFIGAVRSHKVADLDNDVLEGHYSAALLHMANISYRIGKESAPEQIGEVIRSDKDSSEAFERFRGHLSANEVNFPSTPAVLGPWLKVDRQEERFVGPLSRRANRLLGRKYRKPFVVPEEV